jgi:hypothetical protein
VLAVRPMLTAYQASRLSAKPAIRKPRNPAIRLGQYALQDRRISGMLRGREVHPMGAEAAALLLALQRDVYVWRVGVLDSALFYQEHGPVVSTEPIPRRELCES